MSKMLPATLSAAFRTKPAPWIKARCSGNGAQRLNTAYIVAGDISFMENHVASLIQVPGNGDPGKTR